MFFFNTNNNQNKYAKGGEVKYANIYTVRKDLKAKNLSVPVGDTYVTGGAYEGRYVNEDEFEIKHNNEWKTAESIDWELVKSVPYPLQKHYYTQQNVGKVKYLVNYHNGLRFYDDGSEFHDIFTTNNKKDFEKFIKKLEADGYKSRDGHFIYAKGGIIYTPAQKWWGNDLSLNEQKELAKKHLHNYEYDELMGSTARFSTGRRRNYFIEKIWEAEGKPESKLKGLYNDGGEVSPYQHTYMMLGRLQMDCEYFLNWGNRAEKHLWGLNVPDHIAEMKKLWNSLPADAKPEWLTMEQIESYEKDMLNPKN